MAVDMPDRAELAIEPLAGFVERPMIGRMIALDARQHVVGAELPVIDRHAGLGVPAHQPDPRHRPRLQAIRQGAVQHSRVEIVGGPVDVDIAAREQRRRSASRHAPAPPRKARRHRRPRPAATPAAGSDRRILRDNTAPLCGESRTSGTASLCGSRRHSTPGISKPAAVLRILPANRHRARRRAAWRSRPTHSRGRWSGRTARESAASGLQLGDNRHQPGEAEEFRRVLRLAVDQHLVMHVRPGGAAGAAEKADLAVPATCCPTDTVKRCRWP